MVVVMLVAELSAKSLCRLDCGLLVQCFTAGPWDLCRGRCDLLLLALRLVVTPFVLLDAGWHDISGPRTSKQKTNGFSGCFWWHICEHIERCHIPPFIN